MVDVRYLARAEAHAALDLLAELRIIVFRDFPYLYEGDRAYEARYLATYMDAPDAVIVGAFDGDELVGAATATPLLQHDAAFARPIEERGLDAGAIFYFGESVLLPAYRGQGVGVRFFELREEAARAKGFACCLFSAVVRPSDHPLRPADYVALDDFWRRRGYARVPGLQTEYAWRDVGMDDETSKPMEYWIKHLD